MKLMGKMKQIKLRKVNRVKYCLNCRQMVNIVMIGLDGYCPNENSERTGKYLNKLYTIDTRGNDGKK